MYRDRLTKEYQDEQKKPGELEAMLKRLKYGTRGGMDFVNMDRKRVEDTLSNEEWSSRICERKARSIH
jgi:hypothetical protein